VDQVVRGVHAAHGVGQSPRVDEVASYELGVRGSPPGQNLWAPREAAHPQAWVGLEVWEQTPSEVPGGSGQKNGHGPRLAGGQPIIARRRPISHDAP
jgi:hypothetical protein